MIWVPEDGTAHDSHFVGVTLTKSMSHGQSCEMDIDPSKKTKEKD
jgi:hypothetical protein